MRNPADLADRPSSSAARAGEMRTWSAAELRAFLAHTADQRLHAAFLLAATTGMRRGETAGLKSGNIDFEAGRLAVRRSLTCAGYAVSWSEPETERGRSCGPTGPARRRGSRPSGRPTPTRTCLRLRGRRAAPPRALVAAVSPQRSGLRPIRLHDLRHTHATLALQPGVHPKVVSERLGLGDVGITLNISSHAIPAMEEESPPAWRRWSSAPEAFAGRLHGVPRAVRRRTSERRRPAREAGRRKWAVKDSNLRPWD
jgi:integrase